MTSPGGQAGGGGALSTRGGSGARRMKWALELSLGNTRSRSDRQGGQGDVVYPIGYSEKPVPDTSIQETDKNLVEKVSLFPFHFFQILTLFLSCATFETAHPSRHTVLILFK
uniref:ER membrane protein complex subunit 4-like n=1 Tax=Mastacembelus armatus TaxID=205130 RepID=A0A7N8X5P0_9TELE